MSWYRRAWYDRGCGAGGAGVCACICARGSRSGGNSSAAPLMRSCSRHRALVSAADTEGLVSAAGTGVQLVLEARGSAAGTPVPGAIPALRPCSFSTSGASILTSSKGHTSTPVAASSSTLSPPRITSSSAAADAAALLAALPAPPEHRAPVAPALASESSTTP